MVLSIEECDTQTLSQMSAEKLLERLLQYKELYEREAEEFDEYKNSSQEMEQMMEAEIESLKKEVRELQTISQRLTTSGQNAQERNENEKRELLKIEETLRKEVSSLRCDRDAFRSRVRELEQRNDDLERGDRYNHQNLQDLERKLNETLERTALLESELAEKQTSAEEVYRLREELKVSRPRMAVGPLRIERIPSVELPRSSEAPVKACPASALQPSVAPTEKAVSSPSSQPTPTDLREGGLNGAVNKIVKNLLSKVDRLEEILSSLKAPNNTISTAV